MTGRQLMVYAAGYTGGVTLAVAMMATMVAADSAALPADVPAWARDLGMSGLFVGVLWWLLRTHIPEQAKEMRQYIKDKDVQMEALIRDKDTLIANVQNVFGAKLDHVIERFEAMHAANIARFEAILQQQRDDFLRNLELERQRRG